MHHPFAAYRSLFPILQQRAQLASCSQSALCTPVREAIIDYMDVWQTRGADWGYWMEQVAQARAEFARLINAGSADDVAVLGSVSDAASSIASALDFSAARNQILATDLDFPSLCHVWTAQEPRGARVHIASASPGQSSAQATQPLLDAMCANTALVAVSHACYYDGHQSDIGAVSRAAREHGAVAFVDAYQSAGGIHTDVETEQIDCLAAGAQKYLLGIPGIAFLYVRPSLAQTLQPTNTGWFGRVNPFAFDPRQCDFPLHAQRFATGTPPMVNGAAARAGIALLNEIGSLEIDAWLRQLSALAIEEADRLGLRMVNPRTPADKSSVMAFYTADAALIERKMADLGYIVSARNDVIRIAPHFYNTADEVIGALRALASLRA